MPRRRSNTTLVFTGFVLCAVAAIIAILIGILRLLNAVPALLSLQFEALIDGILYLALGLLSLVISMRVRGHYDPILAILLLIFAVLFMVFGLGIGFGLGLEALLVGILLLLGAILLMVGKGA